MNHERFLFPNKTAGLFPKKLFFRVWVLLFIALLGISYFSGIMGAGAKEVVLALVRPFGPGNTVPANTPIISPSAPETWNKPRIIIPAISVDSPVVMASTTDKKILNDDLLAGVVRYPGPAMPGEKGNIVMFGHSSTALVVANRSYKVFNRLDELKPGDTIEIRSDNRKYVYSVIKVETKKADDARIMLDSGGRMLTLSTCDIIGGEESRFVVTAEFVE